MIAVYYVSIIVGSWIFCGLLTWLPIMFFVASLGGKWKRYDLHMLWVCIILGPVGLGSKLSQFWRYKHD